ncbi:AI-2E family transporter [Neobittarella massiliensis]|uniref:AI-2E family transporter n=1 Tax=Neobittarella massiliensis (ex Bilen et al. 2018) TaxID=2041842 RepID=A0A8J6ILF4_9FIRM|nr:AI-2E family transporter [Neobittarella massiliensis]MBC3515649.1 AI-2E family transporter [Neobittarella massiliensis]
MKAYFETLKKYWLPITYAILLYLALNNLGALYEMLSYSMGLISPILIGIFIAFILNLPMRVIEAKLVGRLISREKKPSLCRAVSIVLTILLVLAIFTLLIWYIIPEVSRSVMTLGNRVPSYVQELQNLLIKLSKNIELPKEVIAQLTKTFNDLLESAVNFLSDLAPLVVGSVMGVASSIVNFIMGFVFAIYLLFGKERMLRGIKKVAACALPKNFYDRSLSVCRLTNETFCCYFTGQLTEAFILGGLCFLGMSIFKFPFAPLISVIVGATALIPILGAYIGAIPSALLILIEDPIKALWFVVFIICLQQLEGSLIYPRIVGTSIGLSGFWVMAAMIIGSATYGIMGILLGVPICSVLYTLISRKTNQTLKKKNIQIE